MAARSNSNMMMMGALALGGYYLFQKQKAAPVDPLAVTPTPAAPLQPVIYLTLPPSALTPTTVTPTPTTVTPTTPLQPVINVQVPSTTPPPNVIQTPYGPVTTTPIVGPTVPLSSLTPAQACTAVNPGWTATQCSTRLSELPLRWQYIQSGIKEGREEQARYSAGNPAIAEIQARLDGLAQKGAGLQAEWRMYNGGAAIPEGVLTDAAKKAAYVAFLKAQGWKDKYAGVV